MSFRVAFVGDDELPEVPWIVLRTPDGDFVAIIKESCVAPETVEDAWVSYEYLLANMPDPPERHGVPSEARPIARARRRLGDPGWWEDAQAQAAAPRPLSFAARHPERAAMAYRHSA